MTPIAPAPDRGDRDQHPEQSAGDHRRHQGRSRLERPHPRGIELEDRAPEHQDASRQDQRAAQDRVDQAAGALPAEIRSRHDGDGQAGCRQAPRRKPSDDPPLDGAIGPMDEGPAGLGDGGVEKIGADGGRRMDAEQQDQKRRHQRSTADSRHADESSDTEAGNGVERIEPVQGHDIVHASRSRAKRARPTHPSRPAA